MPEFAWRAAQSDGQLIEGRSQAAAADAVLRQLRERGLTPLKVENAEFRRVLLSCRGLAAAPYVELQSIENSDAGVRLVSACATEGGPTLLVDRGFVSADISARPLVKAADRAMRIEGIRLVHKSGGKSGSFDADSA